MKAKELVQMPTNHRAGTPGSHSATVRLHLHPSPRLFRSDWLGALLRTTGMSASANPGNP